MPRRGALPLPSGGRSLGVPLPILGTRAGRREPRLDRSAWGMGIGLWAPGPARVAFTRCGAAVMMLSNMVVGGGGPRAMSAYDALPWSRGILLVLHLVLLGKVGEKVL